MHSLISQRLRRTLAIQSLSDAKELNHVALLASAYIEMRKNCRPEVVNDDSIIFLLKKASSYLEEISAGQGALSITARNQRCFFRLAARTLLRRAPWLISAKRALETFIRMQPAYLDDCYCFSVDFFSEIIPTWEELLGPWAGLPGLHFLEVGSLEGMSACWLLTHILTHPTSKLTCIDLFDPDHGEQLLVDMNSDDSGKSLFERFTYNIRLAGASDRTNIIVSSSHQALRALPLCSIDCAYLDGSHDSRDVLRDAVFAWELLKPDGLLIFDDYEWSTKLAAKELGAPKVAIDAFINIYGENCALLHMGRQVILKKLK